MRTKAKIIRTEGRYRPIDGSGYIGREPATHTCGSCEAILDGDDQFGLYCKHCGAEFISVTDEADEEPYVKGHGEWESDEAPSTSLGYVFVHREPYMRTPQVIHSSNVKEGEPWMIVPEKLMRGKR